MKVFGAARTATELMLLAALLPLSSSSTVLSILREARLEDTLFGHTVVEMLSVQDLVQRQASLETLCFFFYIPNVGKINPERRDPKGGDTLVVVVVVVVVVGERRTKSLTPTQRTTAFKSTGGKVLAPLLALPTAVSELRQAGHHLKNEITAGEAALHFLGYTAALAAAVVCARRWR